MRRVPKTIRQQHCQSKRVVVLAVLVVLGVLVSAAAEVEQGGCSHKTALDSWAVSRRNSSGTSRL